MSVMTATPAATDVAAATRRADADADADARRCVGGDDNDGEDHDAVSDADRLVSSVLSLFAADSEEKRGRGGGSGSGEDDTKGTQSRRLLDELFAALEVSSASSEAAAAGEKNKENEARGAGREGGGGGGGGATAPTTTATTVRCYHCGCGQLLVEEAVLVCPLCRTLVTRTVDDTPEWRYYGAEDASRDGNPARCAPMAANNLLPSDGTSLCAVHRGAGTQKRGVRTSGYGHGSTYLMQRCHMWNQLTHRERSLYKAFSTLSAGAGAHGILPSIIEDAKHLYKRVTGASSSRGPNRHAMLACSLYVACMRSGAPRAMREVAAMFDTPLPAMTRACRLFREELRDDEKARVAKSARPIDLVARYCCHLGLGSDTRDACSAAVRLIERRDLVTNCTPPSIVASVILLCCSLRAAAASTATTSAAARPKLADVASAAQMSGTTIMKSYRQVAAHTGVLAPILRGEVAAATVSADEDEEEREEREDEEEEEEEEEEDDDEEEEEGDDEFIVRSQKTNK